MPSTFVTTTGPQLPISTSGLATVGVQVTGAWTGVLTFQGTIDSINWFSVNGINLTTGLLTTQLVANAICLVPVVGLTAFRVLAGPWTGTMAELSLAGNVAGIISSLGPSTYIIGKVGIDQTLPGVTNKVVAAIDQTTPGTTNKVVATIDATTPGTTNGVVLRDHYGFDVESTPMDEMRVVNPVRLVGSSFVGTTVDPNFWTVGDVTNTGAVSQGNNQVVLTTGATAASTVSFQSFRSARFVAGSANRYRGLVQLGDTGHANNTRRWGAFTANDGCFFEMQGLILNAVTMKTGNPNRVASAAWNIPLVGFDPSVAHVYEIYWWPLKVHFVIDQIMYHTMSFPNAPWADTSTLPVRAENYNVAGGTINTTLTIRVATIFRLGELVTNTISKNLTLGAPTTTVLKYGAGHLHRVTVNNPLGTSAAIWDGVTGAAPSVLLGTILLSKTATPVTLEYDLPFSGGLTFVVTGATDLTIVYE